MSVGDLILRLRGRAVWRNPARRLLTLDSFARTEEDGGRDIASAARRVGDRELAGHLHRHAADEVKHAELFRRRAAELRAEAGAGGATALEAEVAADSAYDLSRGRPASEVDSHGFLTLGLLDELGEVPYVAMLHVAEKRAAALFRVHHGLTEHDPATRVIFEEILRDENYHVAWTAAVLKGWRENGRQDEVKAALKRATANRWLGGWKRFGARAGGNFGRVVLVVLYCTVLLPFGLAARRQRRGETGWQTGARRAPRAADAAGGSELDRARSQG